MGLAYWQGLLASGDSRSMVHGVFSASEGVSSGAQVSWPIPRTSSPALHSGPHPVGCHGQRARDLQLLPAAGHCPWRRCRRDTVGRLHANRHARLPHRYRRRLHQRHAGPTPTDTVADTDANTITDADGHHRSSLFRTRAAGDPAGSATAGPAMAAAAAEVPLTAIFNPNSGPLPGPAEPELRHRLRPTLENAGGKVVAYVYTDNGTALSPPSKSQSRLISHNMEA